MLIKDLEQIKDKELKEFLKERVFLVNGEKLFKRINYFENKTLNKYIDVYSVDCNDFKRVVFYILNFKTKSEKLKEMALKNLVNYHIKRVYVYVLPDEKLLELGLKIVGTYKNAFLGIKENKYKLILKTYN